MSVDKALFSNDIFTLLRTFPSEALESVVAICKAHRSLSVFPADRADDAHKLKTGADFSVHSEAIARELIWWGSNDLARQIGSAPTWRTIVSNVAKQAGVDEQARAPDLDVWKIEHATLGKCLADWEKLSPEDREDRLKKAGGDFGAARTLFMGVAGGITRLGGKQMLELAFPRVASKAAAALPGVGIALGVFSALTTAYELAGPSHRVLRPAVLTIAYTRQRLLEQQAATVFRD